MTASSAADPEADLYRALGGMDGCRRLATAFYQRVARDPDLRALFPSTLDRAIESLTLFLAQFLGGPAHYSDRRWWLSLREAHLRFPIRPSERDAWLRDMRLALDDIAVAEPLRGALVAFFERSSAHLVNRGAAVPALSGPVPSSARALHEEINRRWTEQLAVEEVVAAVRAGDAARVLALAASPAVIARFATDRAAQLSLLELMLASGLRELLDDAHDRIELDPELARGRYQGGRTLLHGAAATGSPGTVDLLLRLGADPNATDQGGHAPLYSAGNECGTEAGASVVQSLIRAGADVDASGGVKRCTALHMAARRGYVAVATALLDCGADVEARDSQGDTPLRRAVNCGRPEVAALLLARGADPHSVGSKGLTPALSARSPAMRCVLGTTARSR